MNTMAALIADAQHYKQGGGVGGGVLACIIGLWLLFGGGGNKK
jgi:hypothetical protein